MKIFAKLDHPDYGYGLDQEDIKNLDRKKFYEVKSVSMGQFSTYFTLRELGGCYNSVQFEFYDENRNLVDIFDMPEFNPYL